MEESSDEADNEEDDGDYHLDRPGKRKRASGTKKRGVFQPILKLHVTIFNALYP
jgi:hypothetical protein